MNIRIALIACLFLAAVCAPALAASMVVVAPHPDDAEASCGGAIANAVAAGDTVTILTMTGGEKGMLGTKPEKAREIRAKEAAEAASVLGVKLEFFGAVDAELDVSRENTAKIKEILTRLKPDVVLAPWPMDVHPDHQASGMLAWRAFNDGKASFALYFFETSNEPHTNTFQFTPTDYIDITDSIDKKREALFKHKSQYPNMWFNMYVLIATFRGYEADVKYAEGYIRARNSSGLNSRPGRTEKVFRYQD